MFVVHIFNVICIKLREKKKSKIDSIQQEVKMKNA